MQHGHTERQIICLINNPFMKKLNVQNGALIKGELKNIPKYTAAL